MKEPEVSALGGQEKPCNGKDREDAPWLPCEQERKDISGREK
jgi:hypothetical protein